MLCLEAGFYSITRGNFHDRYEQHGYLSNVDKHYPHHHVYHFTVENVNMPDISHDCYSSVWDSGYANENITNNHDYQSGRDIIEARKLTDDETVAIKARLYRYDRIKD